MDKNKIPSRFENLKYISILFIDGAIYSALLEESLNVYVLNNFLCVLCVPRIT